MSAARSLSKFGLSLFLLGLTYTSCKKIIFPLLLSNLACYPQSDICLYHSFSCKAFYFFRTIKLKENRHRLDIRERKNFEGRKKQTKLFGNFPTNAVFNWLQTVTMRSFILSECFKELVLIKKIRSINIVYKFLV